jgi:hypothetical protein
MKLCGRLETMTSPFSTKADRCRTVMPYIVALWYINAPIRWIVSAYMSIRWMTNCRAVRLQCQGLTPVGAMMSFDVILYWIKSGIRWCEYEWLASSRMRNSYWMQIWPKFSRAGTYLYATYPLLYPLVISNIVQIIFNSLLLLVPMYTYVCMAEGYSVYIYLLEIGLYIRLERYTNGIGLMRSCYYHCPTEAANILSSTCLPYTRDRESGIEDSA